LTIHSYALAILLVFFGASSVAIGVWYQRHHQWVFRDVMAVVAALIIAMVYAMVYTMDAVEQSSIIITNLTFLALWSVPPLAIGTYLLKSAR
jgi:hypothetical protein